jgi:isoleucyl-tRNA synthetase
VPFLSEHIFQELQSRRLKTKVDSIHWQDFPRDDKKYINSDIEKEMSHARKIVEAVHEQRAKAGIRVRQPLGVLEINEEFPEEVNNIIRDEVNVKEIKKGEKIALDTKLTPALKEEGFINEFMRHAQDLRKSGGFVPKDKIMLMYSVSSGLRKFIYRWKDALIKQSNASDIIEVSGKKETFKSESEFEWEGDKIWIAVRRISARGGSASGGKKI